MLIDRRVIGLIPKLEKVKPLHRGEQAMRFETLGVGLRTERIHLPRAIERARAHAREKAIELRRVPREDERVHLEALDRVAERPEHLEVTEMRADEQRAAAVANEAFERGRLVEL